MFERRRSVLPRLRKLLGVSVLALVAAALLVAPALAGGPCTYRVTTLAASGPGSLAAAIEAADARGGRHGQRARIVFAVAGEISLGSSALPEITVPLEIDGTSAPGYAEDVPVVAIEGGGALPVGLEVGAAATGSRILGLAIGGFETALALAASHSSVCSNFIGTDLSGLVADPNGTGLEISGDDETIGGAHCCGGAGNLISGNAGYGIVNLGSRNHIAGNLIGTDATGAAPLPNGAAGIRVGATATATLIGGAGEAGPGNTIAFNGGPGVVVDPGATGTQIIANSIFSNEGLGIEVPEGGTAPPSPVLTGLLTGFDSTEAGAVIKGTLAGEPEAAYTLEFFAGETCAPSGQGRTLLGTFAVTTDATGAAAFEAGPLAPLPTGTKFITATATGGASSSTSEFSACLGEPAPPEPEPVRPQPPAPQPLAVASSAHGALAAVASGIEPINGVTVTIEPKVGKVRVMLPGTKRFRPITELESIPIGSTVDAADGKARIASATAFETVQSGAFFGGLFKILQPEGKTLTTMRLLGGPPADCGGDETGPGATASAAAPSSNHLWGSGKGSFRTEGRNGSATVRGTIWFVADRCEGTFFRVNRGIVAVRDFTKQITVSVTAGQSYLARPPAS